MTPAHWSALGILALSVASAAYGARCQRRAAEDRAAAREERIAVQRERMVADHALAVARRLWRDTADLKRERRARA